MNDKRHKFQENIEFFGGGGVELIKKKEYNRFECTLT